MAVEGLKTIFDWSALILGFLTIVAGVGILITGNIIGKRQEERLRHFNLDLTEAKTELGKQETRAADAEAHLEKLRGDNLKLQADLLKLRKESEPRRLAGTQRYTLHDLLESMPTPIAVVSRLFDTEGSDFADDFESAFRAAHWTPIRVRDRISTAYGVSIGFVPEATEPPEINLLSDALTAIGVHHDIVHLVDGDGSMSPHVQRHVLYLLIEQHPPLAGTSPKR
jgi:hypothetical protein